MPEQFTSQEMLERLTGVEMLEAYFAGYFVGRTLRTVRRLLQRRAELREVHDHAEAIATVLVEAVVLDPQHDAG